jgi:hypothetical protein
MGGDCSKYSTKYRVGIIGNANSAIIVDGITLNISSILETVVIRTIKYYRFEFITLYLVSAFLVLLCTIMAIRYFMSRHHVEKGKVYNENMKHNSNVYLSLVFNLEVQTMKVQAIREKVDNLTSIVFYKCLLLYYYV